jgi:TPR repeat protein
VKNSIKLIIAVFCCVGLPAAAAAQSSVSGINTQTVSHRSENGEAAWRALKTGAQAGDAKAQRRLAAMILDRDVPQGEAADPFAGVDLLKQAARAGDYAALIRLEDLRQRRLVHSPSLADMIEIETARAEAGDPVAAWRLAKRYETGEGVAESETDAAKWLEVAASAETARFPKAPEAAFRLCELNALGDEARDPEAARRWCAVAAESGHAGAAIVLKRLAQLQG